MIELLQIGLSMGCVYAMIALGFSVIYRTSGVLNFAQGGFVMLGGLVSAWSFESLHLPLGVSMLLGVLAAMTMGLILSVGVVIPLWRRKSPDAIVTFACLMFLFVIENICLNIFGSKPLALPEIINVRFAGMALQYFILFVVTMTLMFIIWIWLRRSETGQAMKAVAENHMVSRLLGISPMRIALIAFIASSAFGGIGGVLISPIQYALYNLAVVYSVKGFTAAVLGGFGSVSGALIGGLSVGLLEAFTARFISSTYLDSIVLLILFMALVFKSEGLMGSEL